MPASIAATKVLAVQVLRRGDQDRVDALVVEHLPVVDEGFDAGELSFRVFELLRIDIATATNSVFGHAAASRAMALPRSPYPMMPRRMRSFAPSTLRGTDARLPRLVATWPRKARRELMKIKLESGQV